MKEQDKKFQEFKGFTLIVACGDTYWDSFDEEICSFCHEVVHQVDYDDPKNHKDDCPVIKARKALGADWDEHKAKLEQDMLAREQEKNSHEING